jgi:hypothetical protein
MKQDTAFRTFAKPNTAESTHWHRSLQKIVSAVLSSVSSQLAIAAFILITPLLPSPPLQAVGGTGYFRVQNGVIYDPSGNPFIVKGVNAVYGAFAGGDVKNYGTFDYDDQFHTYQGDLHEIARLGGNLIRLMVTVPGTIYYSNGYASYYGSESNYKAEIDKIVKLIRQEGMIALVIPVQPAYSQDIVDFESYLAQTYKNDPYIWVGTPNEPDTCTGTTCWENWHHWHDQYVRAIRATGYQSPIIVNGIYWSGRMDKILQYPLHDNHGNVDMNLIYGPHKYGNDDTDFWTQSLDEVEQYRTGIADDPNNPYAIIIDEVGNYNEGKGDINWMAGFADYVAEWTLGISQHEEGGVTYHHSIGGDGAIAFNWRWSDGNTMVDRSGYNRTEWGDIFYNQYLTRVGSPQTTASPSATATPSVTPGG